MKKFTLEQIAAIEAPEDHVLVSAAAGSGKTTVITERLRFLIKEMNVPAESIICITYTRNAADELRCRLEEMGVHAGFIGTIHSFAYDILGGNGNKEGTDFELYSERHDQAFHKELIEKYAKHITFPRWQEYNMLARKFDKGEVSEAVVNSFLNIYEIAELNAMNGASLIDNTAATFFFEEELVDIWPHETIIDLCQKNNVISFDELIKRATDFYKKKNIQLEHILVDEFQDIGTLEYKFIKALNAKNYYFCGDDFQSIYGFKGADPTIFLSCTKNKKFKVYKLTRNFRCDTSILSLADNIIKQIPANLKMDKIVVGNSKEYGEVNATSFDMFEFLYDLKEVPVQERRNVFVLTRSNSDLKLIKEQLKASKIDALTFRQAELSNEEIRAAMNSPVIKLLTVHSAKGLEADKVFLIGDFSVVPAKWKIAQYNKEIAEGYKPKFDVWEEQRIFYVGATRAKHWLKIYNKTKVKGERLQIVSVNDTLTEADKRKRMWESKNANKSRENRTFRKNV